MSATSSGESEINTMESDTHVPPVSTAKDVAQASVDTSEASDDEGAQLESTVDPSDVPPLPEEVPPPLPTEAPPAQAEDDGWAPVWDDHVKAFYFFNHFTSVSQWENPRVPEIAKPTTPGVGSYDRIAAADDTKLAAPITGGYDPAIHGDYDPTADYAKDQQSTHNNPLLDDTAASDPSQAYAATGTFNRFTGKWQATELNPEKFNDENKSRRQMNAFFDVDAAANSHDGKSLKAERSGKKLSKKEVKAFKDKRREKKEEKRRAWLRD